MSNADHVYQYAYRAPSKTHVDMYEIDGHRMGLKTRKDKLIPKSPTAYRPYCECGWVAKMIDNITDYYVGNRKMARILHSRHIKDIQKQGKLIL